MKMSSQHSTAIKLDPYQIDAVNKLKSGCILCGGTGSGKSRTALAYYASKVCNGYLDDPKKKYRTPRDLYVITTPKKRNDLEWEDEFVPFFFDIQDVKVKVDSWNNITKYTDVHNAFFIFDEQRVIGNGSWAKSFIKISKFNQWILATATPGDTWSDYIPVFIANGFYRNRTEFNRRHAVFSRYSKYPKIERWLEERRLQKLKEAITVTLDYKKKTVHHEEVIVVGYSKQTYKIVSVNRWDPYENVPIQEISECGYLMRKVVNSDPSRIDVTKQIVLDRKKCIIFYNFDYELELLRKMGEELKVKTAEYNGHKHDPLPTGDSWIYLVQYTAGSEAWNCTSTDTIIFYSQSYSYKSTIQAMGRIDRRNTPFKDLYYYKIRSAAPIDLAIASALKKKKNFNERAFIPNVSREKNMVYDRRDRISL